MPGRGGVAVCCWPGGGWPADCNIEVRARAGNCEVGATAEARTRSGPDRQVVDREPRVGAGSSGPNSRREIELGAGDGHERPDAGRVFGKW